MVGRGGTVIDVQLHSPLLSALHSTHSEDSAPSPRQTVVVVFLLPVVGHGGVVVALVVNIVAPVDRVSATTLTSRMGEDCSTLSGLVICQRLCMSIVVGTRGGLGTSMPLSGLEAVFQDMINARAREE
jgi:hypothetical protein